MTCLAALSLTEGAEAQLVPQMDRCGPRPNGPDLTWLWQSPTAGRGWGNDPTKRPYLVQLAWAPGPLGESAAKIAEDKALTKRIDICWIDSTGAIACPGMGPGCDKAWFFQIDGKPENIPFVKGKPGDAVKSEDQLTLLAPNFDWDKAGNQDKVLFLWVTATGAAPAPPASLAAINPMLATSGYCPAISRVAQAAEGRKHSTLAAAGGAGAVVPGGSTSSAGPTPVNWVVYGVPSNFATPPGWTFGSVCNGGSNGNLAKGPIGANPCVDPGAVGDWLDRLTDIELWQQRTVQGGLLPSQRLHTWNNGLDPDQNNTCSGVTCPTRVLWVSFGGGAGFGWGGLYADASQPPAHFQPLGVESSGVIRNKAHEYFHGLQQTYGESVSMQDASLVLNPDFLESAADSAEWAACSTNYPANDAAAGGDSVPADKCVSTRTLYGGFYTYGGLIAAPCANVA